MLNLSSSLPPPLYIRTTMQLRVECWPWKQMNGTPSMKTDPIMGKRGNNQPGRCQKAKGQPEQVARGDNLLLTQAHLSRSKYSFPRCHLRMPKTPICSQTHLPFNFTVDDGINEERGHEKQHEGQKRRCNSLLHKPQLQNGRESHPVRAHKRHCPGYTSKN